MKASDNRLFMAINPQATKSYDTYIDNLFTIDCGLGSNPLGAPPEVERFWKNYTGQETDQYYNFSRMVELSILVGDYLRIPGERIYFCNGSIALLSTIFFKLFSEKPKSMIGVGPQFVSAVSEWKLSGGSYEFVELKPQQKAGTDLEPLIETIQRKPPTVVYIDNPNNPTGRVFSLSELKQVAEVCEQIGSFLIVDEAYGDFLAIEASAVSLTDSFDGVIVVRSFSKGLGMAAMRLGYAVVSESMIEYFQKIIMTFLLSLSSIELAIHVLPNIDPFLKKCRAEVRARKEMLIRSLSDKGIEVWDSHPDVPIFLAHHRDIPLYSWLLNLGIKTESGAHFAVTADFLNEHYCRIRVPGSRTHLAHFIYRLKAKKLP